MRSTRTLRLAWCALLAAVFIAGACKDRVVRETEPNDTYSNANPLALNTIVEGTLERDNDTDSFRVEISEPLVLDISLSGVKGVNQAFQLLRYNKGAYDLLKHVDDQRKSSAERFCNLYALPGTYYIAVMHGDKDPRHVNKETSYRLKVASRGIKDYEERETNDSAETANPIPVPGDVYGFFSPAVNRYAASAAAPRREEDWFSFDIRLEEDKPILLDLELSGVPMINSIVQVFTADMEELGKADIGEIGKGESLRGVGITKSGRYLIMIASRNAEANHDIPYSLKVSKRDYNFSLEMEPNNSFDRANLLAENQVTGTIHPRGDVDFFRVHGGESMLLYRIEAAPAPDIDAPFRIYNDKRELLWETDAPRRGERSVMPAIALHGDFFIEIFSKTGAANLEKPYLLTLTSKPYADGWEAEPNDVKARATRITGKTVLGFTSKRNDVDYYLFEYNRRARCRYTIKPARSSEINVSATDPMGYILKTVTAKDGKPVRLDEMIDNRGYLVIQSVAENLEEPYLVEVDVE